MRGVGQPWTSLFGILGEANAYGKRKCKLSVVTDAINRTIAEEKSSHELATLTSRGWVLLE